MTKTRYSVPPPFTEGYLNRAQLASYLGVSRSTISNLIRTGSLPKPLQIGKRTLRWKRLDIDEYLKKSSGE